MGLCGLVGVRERFSLQEKLTFPPVFFIALVKIALNISYSVFQFVSWKIFIGHLPCDRAFHWTLEIQR
jgi:hypothetical protein